LRLGANGGKNLVTIVTRLGLKNGEKLTPWRRRQTRVRGCEGVNAFSLCLEVPQLLFAQANEVIE